MGAETDSFARAAVVDVATVVGIADVVDDDVAGDAVVGSVVPGGGEASEESASLLIVGLEKNEEVVGAAGVLSANAK